MFRYATILVTYMSINFLPPSTISPMKRKSTVFHFGQRLAAIRKQRGLSQRTLGKTVGVSGRVIAYYEKQTKHPPAHLLSPLCRALKVSSDELLGLKSFKQDIDSKDYFLWKRFKKVTSLSIREKKTVFSFINALLTKHTFKTTKQ